MQYGRRFSVAFYAIATSLQRVIIPVSSTPHFSEPCMLPRVVKGVIPAAPQSPHLIVLQQFALIARPIVSVCFVSGPANALTWCCPAQVHLPDDGSAANWWPK
jgi:hypothetical protein